ncbi:MAG TPA: homoserine dehydrogenase [Anaerolineaceae bacterium]|nr:homoserine dehydrogenase [Anaerolineaceae bacterium]
MREYQLALVGFGNVGQALALLLEKKQEVLQKEFGFSTRITGIATGSHGKVIHTEGVDIHAAIQLVRTGGNLATLNGSTSALSIQEFIKTVPADVLFENSPVNHHTGQPALDHLRTALECGMHAITANKGPVVYGYDQLTRLAQEHNHRFLFESAVMDGAPIFSLFRGPLPAAELKGFHGILNSCTNLLIEMMEGGKTFEEAVEYGRSIGITETDPSADIDGWDAAIKVAALSTVLMGVPLTPDQVQREGIRGITPQMISEALQAGERWKLVCSARRGESGVHARVQPQRVMPSSPLYSINGTSSFVQFEMDTLPGLGILESNPGPETTAYGLLADLINAVRGR